MQFRHAMRVANATADSVFGCAYFLISGFSVLTSPSPLIHENLVYSADTNSTCVLQILGDRTSGGDGEISSTGLHKNASSGTDGIVLGAQGPIDCTDGTGKYITWHRSQPSYLCVLIGIASAAAPERATTVSAKRHGTFAADARGHGANTAVLAVHSPAALCIFPAGLFIAPFPPRPCVFSRPASSSPFFPPRPCVFPDQPHHLLFFPLGRVSFPDRPHHLFSSPCGLLFSHS